MAPRTLPVPAPPKGVLSVPARLLLLGWQAAVLLLALGWVVAPLGLADGRWPAWVLYGGLSGITLLLGILPARLLARRFGLAVLLGGGRADPAHDRLLPGSGDRIAALAACTALGVALLAWVARAVAGGAAGTDWRMAHGDPAGLALGGFLFLGLCAGAAVWWWVLPARRLPGGARAALAAFPFVLLGAAEGIYFSALDLSPSWKGFADAFGAAWWEIALLGAVGAGGAWAGTRGRRSPTGR